MTAAILEIDDTNSARNSSRRCIRRRKMTECTIKVARTIPTYCVYRISRPNFAHFDSCKN